MKALVVTTISNTVNAFLIPHIKLLIEQGYQVDVAFNTVQEVDEELAELGCKVHQLEFQRSPMKKENYKAFKKLKELIKVEKYDLVHTHTPIASVCVRLACWKQKNIKVIYTAHGFHFFKGAPLKNWLLHYPIERWLARYTDVLITINKEDFGRAKKSFKAKDIEYVSGVGIDLDGMKKVHIDKVEKRKQLGIPEEALVVLSVGELNENKNHRVVIEALAKFARTDVYYVVCGCGAEEDKLTALSAELGLNEQVKLLGYRTDVEELYKIADIFAFPSQREGLPVSLMEAMASGLPVVCSKVRGNVDLIENEKGGFLLDPLDIDGFAAAIDTLVKNQWLRELMGSFNVGSVKQFDIKLVNKNMKEIYEKKSTKVLHILNTDHFSGAENLVCQIMNMYKNDDDFEMVYCSPDGPIREALIERKIPYLPINKLDLQELKIVMQNFRPDIIHAHDIRASVLAASCKGKAKLISHIHGNHEDMRKLTMKSLLFRAAALEIDHIIWVSDSALANYRFQSAVSEKSEVLSNILDMKNLHTKMDQDSNFYKYDIVFIGRLSYAKDPMRLMKVLKMVIDKVPQVKVAIIGEGDMQNQTKHFADEIGILNKIKFLGFMSNPLKLLKDAKVMLMTSIYEGTPMCVLEAMSLGVPLVSTPTDGIKDIISEGKTGFLSDDDDVLASKVISLLYDGQKRREMSKVCVERAIQLNDVSAYKSAIGKAYYA